MPATHATFPHLGASDYSGDDVMAESNRHTLAAEIRTAAQRETLDGWTHRGSYGYTDFLIPLHDSQPAELWGSLVAAVRKLQDYALLDESDYSEREYATEHPAWLDYGRADAYRHLQQWFNADEADDYELACNRMRENADGSEGESIESQRLHHWLHETGRVWRESPGSTWIYPYADIKSAEQALAILTTRQTWEADSEAAA